MGMDKEHENMENVMSAATIPAIVGICAIVNYCIKQFTSADRLHDFIPTISCLLGLCLAIGNAYFTGGLSSSVLLDIVFSGMASGLAATGAYEAVTHWNDTANHGQHAAQD